MRATAARGDRAAVGGLGEGSGYCVAIASSTSRRLARRAGPRAATTPASATMPAMIHAARDPPDAPVEAGAGAAAEASDQGPADDDAIDAEFEVKKD